MDLAQTVRGNTMKASETPPGLSQTKARLAGICYVGTIVAGVYAEAYVRGSLVVRTDAAATIGNIVSHETLYRTALVADLVMLACYVAVTTLFYALFRPVSRDLSLAAAAFSMIGIAVFATASLLHLAPLHLLDRPDAALTALVLHGKSYGISLVFFGIYCILIGALTWRSGFLPRVIGALMIVAGLCYLVNSVTGILLPAFARQLPSQILLPTLIGEAALALWLTIFGVTKRRVP
jgi:Domain of unknown function (DUF4386)